MLIGKLIQAYREKYHITVRGLAKTIGVGHTILWKFEQGKPVETKAWVKIATWVLTKEA
jgi:transcriptional regulator with XRE-family HTH domain